MTATMCPDPVYTHYGIHYSYYSASNWCRKALCTADKLSDASVHNINVSRAAMCRLNSSTLNVTYSFDSSISNCMVQQCITGVLSNHSISDHSLRRWAAIAYIHHWYVNVMEIHAPQSRLWRVSYLTSWCQSKSRHSRVIKIDCMRDLDSFYVANHVQALTVTVAVYRSSVTRTLMLVQQNDWIYTDQWNIISPREIETRKPCCRKGTARCRSCCFWFKFADNIDYKFKSSQASKARLQTYRRKTEFNAKWSF